MKMKQVAKRKATGVLAEMLAGIDEESIAKTRNRMLLAIKISDAMKGKGLTQKQFSRMMGKTESEVSDWLSGDRNFTVDTMTSIERVLGVRLLDTGVHKYSCIQQADKRTNVISLPYSGSKRYDFEISQRSEYTDCVNF